MVVCKEYISEPDLLTIYNTAAATVALVFILNNQYKYTYSQNY